MNRNRHHEHIPDRHLDTWAPAQNWAERYSFNPESFWRNGSKNECTPYPHMRAGIVTTCSTSSISHIQ
ncbi:unnamed protein product [Penicillium discolor]